MVSEFWAFRILTFHDAQDPGGSELNTFGVESCKDQR